MRDIINYDDRSFPRGVVPVAIASVLLIALTGLGEAADKYFSLSSGTATTAIWTFPNTWRSGSPSGPATGMPTAQDRAIFAAGYANPNMAFISANQPLGQILVTGHSWDPNADGFGQGGSSERRLYIHGLAEGNENLGFDLQANSFFAMMTTPTLAADQTWRISNPDGGTIYFAPGDQARMHYLDLQDYTLTIDAVAEASLARVDTELRGDGGIIKTGAGTMSLGNPANSFTGATVVDSGALALVYNDRSKGSTDRIGGRTNINAPPERTGDGTLASSSGVEVRSAGTLDISGIQALETQIKTLSGSGNVVLGEKTLTLTTASDIFAGVISGNGGLKLAAGTETLTGENTYSGPTTLETGAALAAGAPSAFSAQSAHRLMEGSSMLLDANSQTVGALENGGVVHFGETPGTTLTVSGDYSGNGGTLVLSSALGDDTSMTDRLVVNGDTSGTTNVQVINVDGGGANTVEGIRIVEVGGNSDGSFLLIGDYEYQGQQAVVGGAYAYTLHQHGISTPSDGNWYLRSALTNPPQQTQQPGEPSPQPGGPPQNPPTPPPVSGSTLPRLYQAGVPIYESYAGALLTLNGLSTLRQRVGDRNVAIAHGSAGEVWGRVESRLLRASPSTSSTGASYENTAWQIEAGIDRWIVDDDSRLVIGGLTLLYGKATTDVSSVHGNGFVDSISYGAGATLTWHFPNGNYTDVQARMNWIHSHLASGTANRTLIDQNTAFGYSLGLEVGRSLQGSQFLAITPQAQLVYSRASHDDFVDPFGARVSSGANDSLKGRLGFAAEHVSGAGAIGEAKLYGIANLHYELLNGTSTEVAGVTFSNKADPMWVSVGAGASYAVGDNLSLYGEVDLASNVKSFGETRSLSGTIGMTLRW